jgi:hypothetical protein
MPRARMIKPEFWEDEKVAELSCWSRLTYIALWNFADDFGRVKGNPKWLLHRIFPYDDHSATDLQSWLDELERLDRISPYEVNNEKYYIIINFSKHQRVNNKSNWCYPCPPLDEDSLSSNVLVHEESHRSRVHKTKTKTKTKTNILCENLKSKTLLFDVFWELYPKIRRVGKSTAEKAFLKIKDIEKVMPSIICALEKQSKTEQWTNHNGKYIPHPSTWLNGRRWEDEVVADQCVSEYSVLQYLKKEE